MIFSILDKLYFQHYHYGWYMSGAPNRGMLVLLESSWNCIGYRTINKYYYYYREIVLLDFLVILKRMFQNYSKILKRCFMSIDYWPYNDRRERRLTNFPSRFSHPSIIESRRYSVRLYNLLLHDRIRRSEMEACMCIKQIRSGIVCC